MRPVTSTLLAAAAALVLGACAAQPAGEGDVAVADTPSAGTPAPTAPRAPATSAASTSPAPATPVPGTAAATPTRPAPSVTVPRLPVLRDRGLVEGADASWPQCPRGLGMPQKRTLGAPMPLDGAEFVVLGLTNGPGFHPNPCLADQVAWAKGRHLLVGAYSVVSWPEQRFLEQYAGQGPYDASTRAGQLGNVGYQQALFNLATMRRAGLETPSVWVDVEPVPDFDWSPDPAANAAVVRGAVRGYAEAGYQVGVYSTSYLWQQVVGDLRLGLREWRAAGQTSRQEALRRCGPEAMFQGGAPVITQWVEQDRDRDVTCPGESTYLGLWFRQY